ncbi:hypothetical protein JNB11_07465 [Kocuria palustris]|nr:hypothetical protein [Kocuria palustris]
MRPARGYRDPPAAAKGRGWRRRGAPLVGRSKRKVRDGRSHKDKGDRGRGLAPAGLVSAVAGGASPTLAFPHRDDQRIFFTAVKLACALLSAGVKNF